MIPGTAESYIQNGCLQRISQVICGASSIMKVHRAILTRYSGGNMDEKENKVKPQTGISSPYASFSTFNVLIDRTVFSKFRFNEELQQYGHEDTLFSYQLKKAGIDIIHIDNGLFHEGLESNRDFLNKTKPGIENLSKLYDSVTDKKTF